MREPRANLARPRALPYGDLGVWNKTLDTTSNGEYLPPPPTPGLVRARALASEQIGENAKRRGLGRRAFLSGLCGTATTLLALNRAHASLGNLGGSFAVAADAGVDIDAALASLAGREFIFDVQTHHIDASGPWRKNPLSYWNLGLRAFPQSRCNDGFLDRVFGSIDCFDTRHYMKEMFLDSDTDMAVLTFVPSLPEDTPLEIREADATRNLVDALEGSQRLLLHGRVHPNLPGQIERMDELSERWKIAAWKTYTGFGPGGKGYFLDDPEVGIPFIEKARALGIKRICIHKGLPLPGQEYDYSTCRDIGPVAKRFPDVSFLVYHSGYEVGRKEGPYVSGQKAPRGIDGLIASLEQSGIGRNQNVYAEIGSTWRQLMRDPTSAAHGIGKLLKYVGEDRLLWGTDSIWYGSPQDQISAFRAFQISPELRAAHDYPELTPRLRAKVFGLNALAPYGIDLSEVQKRAARDIVTDMRLAYAERPGPSLLSYGPKTRREVLTAWRLHGSRP